MFFLVLAHEFVEIYESCPSRFRAKVDSKQQVGVMYVSALCSNQILLDI